MKYVYLFSAIQLFVVLYILRLNVIPIRTVDKRDASCAGRYTDDRGESGGSAYPYHCVWASGLLARGWCTALAQALFIIVFVEPWREPWGNRIMCVASLNFLNRTVADSHAAVAGQAVTLLPTVVPVPDAPGILGGALEVDEYEAHTQRALMANGWVALWAALHYRQSLEISFNNGLTPCGAVPVQLSFRDIEETPTLPSPAPQPIVQAQQVAIAAFTQAAFILPGLAPTLRTCIQ